MAVNISLLKSSDIPLIISAFKGSEWRTPVSHYRKLLAAQKKKEIDFLLARSGSAVAGFLYINWRADYPPFAAQNIPEIRDLRVLEAFRRRGIAAALMDEAEKRIFQRSPAVGLGVGLYADYGVAQRLYVRRGYLPDGRGIMYKNQPVSPGSVVSVDDDLLLYFTKQRPRLVLSS